MVTVTNKLDINGKIVKKNVVQRIANQNKLTKLTILKSSLK